MSKLKKLSEELSQKYRKLLLQSILDKVKAGEFENNPIDPNKLYMLHSPVRQEYRSPAERSSFNRGEMNIWEIDAGMDEAY